MPKHPFRLGVTVIIEEIAVVPGFTAVKPGMFPLPLADNPIAGYIFVSKPGVKPGLT